MRIARAPAVPTIFYPYDNYMELASAAAVPTHARDASRVDALLRLLLGGAELRRELGATQRHFAAWFTPSAIAGQWARTLEALCARNI